MATGEESDDETLGGAQMHAETSGLADYLAEDEMDAIRIGREVVSHLNWRKRGNKPLIKSEEPINDPEVLLGLVDPDLKKPFDIKFGDTDFTYMEDVRRVIRLLGLIGDNELKSIYTT